MNKFSSNAAYRAYMTNNASKIIQENYMFAKKNINHKYSSNFKIETAQPPHFFRTIMDYRSPNGYETNQTKEDFLNEYRNEGNIISRSVSI